MDDINVEKLQLILLIEDAYNIRITDQEVDSLETIQQLLTLISKKLGY
jgi:acyl carrier protein